MAHRDIDKQVRAYDRMHSKYEVYTTRMMRLLEQLLREDGTPLHAIEYRVKSVESFRRKACLPDKEYDDPLRQIPDLAGLRIIVYRLQDIETVSGLIESELKVLKRTSAGEGTDCEPEKFGYRSIHLDVMLDDRRAALTEWSDMEDMMAEIQVRTVLQHAWAAVSHALEYKSEAGLNEELRHRLARLAGILELADEEFSAISRGFFRVEPAVRTKPVESTDK